VICDACVFAQYYLLCPEVRCPELTPNCVTVEYFEVEYEYTRPTNSGKLVILRCRNCEYCIDVPAPVAELQRRRDPDLPSTAFDNMTFNETIVHNEVVKLKNIFKIRKIR